MDSNKVVRFLLTFFLGFIGSFIINHTSLKPEGFKSRTLAYFFLSMITFPCPFISEPFTSNTNI